MIFQSTLPARGATRCVFCVASRGGFQSTLPARGATEIPVRVRVPPSISIHAPRTGSDENRSCRCMGGVYFNPRSPHGERLFRLNQYRQALPYFNPRSPHGERPRRNTHSKEMYKFQSTLPARGATRREVTRFGKGRFQSTLPARGATRRGSDRAAPADISIHAPRTGSDSAK